MLTKIQYNEKIFDKREFLLNGMENKKNRPNLNEDVYEAIKRRLGSKDLKPGTKIKEEQLAEELEVSRTPLGEAINKLERDWWKLFLKRGLL